MIMKKIMLFVAAVLLSTILLSCKGSKNDPKNSEYPEVTTRNCILLEECTGQNCPNCPPAIKKVRKVVEAMQNGHRIAWVAHHYGYYSDEFTQKEDITITNSLFKGYEGTYAPAGFLDRTKLSIKGGTEDYNHLLGDCADSTLLNSLLAVPAEASIVMKATLDADNTLTVTMTGKSNQEEAYVSIWLCQNGIVSWQSNGGDSYTHNEVIRAYLTPAAGSELTIDEEKKYKYTATYKIPAEISNYDKSKSFATDIDNMYIVGFVHGKLSNHGVVYNADQMTLKSLRK